MSSSLLANKSGAALVSNLKKKLEAKNFVIERTHFFIFVCGGSNQNSNNLRSLFLQYAKIQMTQYRFLLAEHALQIVNKLHNITFQNIAEFEKIMAELADCVIIFPESPGSFAEVGYFSKMEQVTKKTLLVTTSQYQNDSFITSGPMDIIDRQSDFRQRIILPKRNPKTSFELIKNKLQRLESLRGNQSRKSFNSKFSTYDLYEMTILILKFIELHPGISLEDLKAILFKHFTSVITKRVDNIVGILIQSELVIYTISAGHTFLQIAQGIHSGAKIGDLEDNSHKLNFINLTPKLYEV